MTINQLELTLYVLYVMDTCMPPSYGKWLNEFKRVSYSQWALEELVEFISKEIYPRTEATLAELCDITYKFMVKMEKYSRVNMRTNLIFRTAAETVEDVLDLLMSMK